MVRSLVFVLVFVHGIGGLQARPRHTPHPRRASARDVVAFMRKDLALLPADTRFKRVHWNPTMQEWEVTLEPPYLFDVWAVNALATDYSRMCFF